MPVDLLKQLDLALDCETGLSFLKISHTQIGLVLEELLQPVRACITVFIFSFPEKTSITMYAPQVPFKSTHPDLDVGRGPRSLVRIYQDARHPQKTSGIVSRFLRY